MKILTDPSVDKDLNKLKLEQRAIITRVVNLFRDRQFLLTQLHLKKLTKDIWELRADRYRLLFGMVDDNVIIVNAFYKKTQKTPKKEIELAVKRLKEYI